MAGRKQGEGVLALGLADKDGEAASRGEQAGGGEESLIELLDGAHGDKRGALRKALGAGVKDGETGEVEIAADFAEEGGFLAVSFDESELELWCPVLHGEAGESCTAAEIENLLGGVAGEELGGGEEGLSEVADDHFLGGAEGGEVHALIPAEEEREVGGDGFEEGSVKGGGEGSKEGREIHRE